MIKVDINGVTYSVYFKHFSKPDVSVVSGTTCYIEEAGSVLHIGEAKKAVQDQFCRRKGRKVSFTRAVSLMKDKPMRKLFWDAFNAKELRK